MVTSSDAAAVRTQSRGPSALHLFTQSGFAVVTAAVLRLLPRPERVEVLPFHQMGRDKWDALGMRYELADTRPPTPELVERVRGQFRARGLEVH